jgi:hypothetical protein
MISSSITVTTTPTLLVAETANATRYVYLEPKGNDVHVGGSNVTSTTGLTITNGSQFEFVLPPQNSLYGVTTSGTHTMIILQPSGDF